MAANARRRSRGRRDVYREITESILDALEGGTVPWRRPWRDFGMQRNYSSARPYRGINQLLTQLTQQARGYGSPFWLTYRGAQRAGGNVRRGERGSMVVLWKRLLIEDEETAERRTVWWIRPYTVFNLDQVDGVEPPPLQDELLRVRTDRALRVAARLNARPADGRASPRRRLLRAGLRHDHAAAEGELP